MKYKGSITKVYQTLLHYKSSKKLISLANGLSGITLFLAYYARFFNDVQAEKKYLSFFEEMIGFVETEEYNFKFAGGLSGFAWTYQHLINENILSASPDLLDDLEEYFLAAAIEDLNKGNYDYLHGGLGIGLYFLERNRTQDAEAPLQQIAVALFQLLKPSKFGYWVEYPNLFGRLKEDAIDKKICNLGLSHGLPSILVFLSQLYGHNIFPEQCQEYVKGIVNFLLQIKDKQVNTSHYSYTVQVSNNAIIPIEKISRVGWCYGDLSIAIAMMRAAKTFHDPSWEKEAIQIALSALSRHENKYSLIEDEGICHGYAGVAHISQRFYHWTKIEKFRNESNYWNNRLIKHLEEHENSLFKKINMANSHHFACEYLTGLSGIGLYFIAKEIQQENSMNWDRSLLIG